MKFDNLKLDKQSASMSLIDSIAPGHDRDVNMSSLSVSCDC